MYSRNSASPQTVLAVSSLFHSINDATLAILPAVLPFLVQEFALSYFDVGVLYGVMLTVMVVFQLLAGVLADKFDELDLLAVGCFLIVITCLLLSYSSSYLELFLFNMVYAVGYSIFHPVSYTVLSRAYESPDRAKSMGISGAIGDFGNLIAFVSTGIVASLFNWRASFLVWGLLALAALGFYFVALRPRKPLLSPPTEVGVDQAVRASKLGALGWRFTLLVFASCIFMGAIYRTFINYTTLFLTDVVGMTPIYADFIFALFILAGVVGAFLSGYLAKYFGLRRVLTMEFLILATAMFLLYIDKVQTFYPVLLLLLVNGFALYASYPVIYSLAAEMAGFRSRGLSYGFTISITFTGAVGLSIIGGMLADFTANISIVYILGAIIAFFAVITVNRLPHYLESA